MSFLTDPNLPVSTVTTVIIDGRAPQSMIAALRNSGISPIYTCAHPDVYPAVAYHPDIMLHHIGDNIIVYAPGTSTVLLSVLEERGFRLVQGHTKLGSKYPMTIPYNVARIGKYAFHNTKYTDPVVKEQLQSMGIELIHTNQGYTKCLTCIVDSNSIITSDADISKRARETGLDALIIEPDEAIRLEPLNMGFFGGATGLIGKNRLAVAGDLRFHKNYQKILEFLSLKCVDVVMLNDGKLIDLGTIIPIEQK
ncbi:MAG: hypothetical protein K0R50_2776 [Eubacterium sp.]|nr:hypothetical protein [Eubacterium sp.]